MHKYILKLTRYSEQGALTSDVQFVTADTPQSLSDLKTKYDKMRYTNEDGSVGMKLYEVKVMQGVYKEITDWDGFCVTNAVLR